MIMLSVSQTRCLKGNKFIILSISQKFTCVKSCYSSSRLKTKRISDLIETTLLPGNARAELSADRKLLTKPHFARL